MLLYTKENNKNIYNYLDIQGNNFCIKSLNDRIKQNTQININLDDIIPIYTYASYNYCSIYICILNNNGIVYVFCVGAFSDGNDYIYMSKINVGNVDSFVLRNTNIYNNHDELYALITFTYDKINRNLYVNNINKFIKDKEENLEYDIYFNREDFKLDYEFNDIINYEHIKYNDIIIAKSSSNIDPSMININNFEYTFPYIQNMNFRLRLRKVDTQFYHVDKLKNTLKKFIYENSVIFFDSIDGKLYVKINDQFHNYMLWKTKNMLNIIDIINVRIIVRVNVYKNIFYIKYRNGNIFKFIPCTPVGKYCAIKQKNFICNINEPSYTWMHNSIIYIATKNKIYKINENDTITIINYPNISIINNYNFELKCNQQIYNSLDQYTKNLIKTFIICVYTKNKIKIPKYVMFEIITLWNIIYNSTKNIC
jgi:hypothetical protein